jgi:hypothetical protein
MAQRFLDEKTPGVQVADVSGPANQSLQTDRGPYWGSETSSSAGAAAAERVVRPRAPHLAALSGS